MKHFNAVLPPHLASARIRVEEPRHLCRLQSATRELCRAVGMSESAVFQVVIAATELAHRRLIEESVSGDVELSAVRRAHGLAFEVRARPDLEDLPPARLTLPFPPAPPSAAWH